MKISATQLQRIVRDAGPVNRRRSGSDRPQQPPWAALLAQFIERAPQLLTFQKNEPSFIDPQSPLPFEEFLAPLVTIAAEQLKAGQTAPAYSRLSPAAHLQLQRGLLRRLTHIAAATLAYQFFEFRKTGAGPDRIPPGPAPVERRLYQRFIEILLRQQAVNLFQRYSVMARMLCEVTLMWIDAVGEFLQRLDRDLPELAERFNAQAALTQVCDIQYGLSDHHQNGRTVLQLRFGNGLQLIYKPKDAAIEQAYFDFLAWLNRHRAPLPLLPLTVLNRGSYGWIEYVQQRPCRDEAAAARYYQRCGMLLCLFYVLGGTDFHNENIIACGEHPVAIDLETLFHHPLRLQQGLMDDRRPSLANFSVRDTHFLPEPNGAAGNSGFDISGLGIPARADCKTGARRLVNINRDDMAIAEIELHRKPPRNTVMLNGRACSPLDYRDAVIRGFEAMYRFLISRREAILADEGPFAKFADTPTRVIFRNTLTYARVLHRALSPEFLQNGADFSTQLQTLARQMPVDAEAPLHGLILKFEQEDLLKMDIPKFSSRANSDGLTLPDRTEVPGCFTENSFEMARARLRQLNREDLAKQSAYLSSVLPANPFNRKSTTKGERHVWLEEKTAAEAAGE